MSPFLKSALRIVSASLVAALVLGAVFAYVQHQTEVSAIGILSNAGTVATSPGSEPPQPPPNAFMMSADSSRGFVWLSDYSESKAASYRRWDPVSGNVTQLQLPPDLNDLQLSTILEIRAGIMFLGLQKSASDQIVALLTQQNKIRSAKLTIKRETPHLIELQDGSVLVIGGIVGYEGETKKFTNAVERISFAKDTLLSFSDAISVERLPDVPGEIRRGISTVELSDGRVMALGGSWSPYTGNEPMTAETYLLDVAAKTWHAGPKMVEARANATATLLQDGNVLVAGGWTPKNTWNSSPARTTELWSPRSNSFVQGNPLPIGVANQQAIWMSNRRGKELLLVGGWAGAWRGNQSVLRLELSNNSWRTAGDGCKASDQMGELKATPFEYNNRSYVWCQTPYIAWNLVPLRLSSIDEAVLPQIASDSGFSLHRSGMAFLAPIANLPGLAVGGSGDGGESAAVDAVWLDGRLQGLAPLNHARRNAKVFRLKNGSFLVAGGLGGDATRRTQYVPPIELLMATATLEEARWVDITPEVQDIAGMTLLSDDSLLIVHSTGDVESLAVTVSGDKPAVKRKPYPSLNRRRMTLNGSRDEISVRELPDGRILVLGGQEQYHRIALLSGDVLRADAPDRFVYVGETIPALDYEIYDPMTKRWSESASSSATFYSAAILDDGRVVKWGVIEESLDPWERGHNTSFGQRRAIVEISSADGKGWAPLNAQVPPLVATEVINRAPELFVIQGELFLFGMRPTDVTADHWRGNAMVQWFNTTNSKWETMWESAPNENWRDHIGRIIIRDLPNGKRIALPVSGLSGRGSAG